MIEVDEDHITGVMIQYYYTCERELWFFANNINMNYEDDNIRIGSQIQRESYDRDTKNIMIDNTISIDVMKDTNTIFEVKKSSTLEKPAKMQLKYYLWYLKNKKGIEFNGVLAYPKEKKREKIKLTENDEKELEIAIKNIKEIISKDNPPNKKKKPFCENCSYYNLCWV